MYEECSGEPCTDWQRRWLIQRLIKNNKSSQGKVQYPDWHTQKPTKNYSTRLPVLPSSTSETYMYEPDYDGDPYQSPEIWDRVELTFEQIIKVSYLEFVMKNNMNISRSERKQIDDFSHTAVRNARHGHELVVAAAPKKKSGSNWSSEKQSK